MDKKIEHWLITWYYYDDGECGSLCQFIGTFEEAQVKVDSLNANSDDTLYDFCLV